MALLPPDPLFCLKSDMEYVHSMCFISEESKTTNLLAVTENGFVYLWDLQTSRVRNKQHLGASIQVIHSVDNGDIITQEKSGAVKLWNPQNETNYSLVLQYESSGGYCRSIVIDNQFIIPQANSIDLLDIETMQPIRTFRPVSDKLGYAMCLEKVELGGNIFLMAGYETGDVLLWDLATAKPCGHLKLSPYITSITFDSVLGRGVCGNSSNILQVFTIDKSFNMKVKCEITITNEGCNIVKLRHDRKILATGGWDNRLRLFSWKSLRLLVVLNEHKKSVTDIQFSKTIVPAWNSNVMAVGGADGMISLWNLYN